MNELKALKYLLNIQLFGDDETEPVQEPETIVETPQIDYEKLADTLAKRTSATEESALKGILKDHGLSKEQLTEAVRGYREAKELKAKEEQERLDRIIKENKEYKQKELMELVTNEARDIAKELNVRAECFDKLMRLCKDAKFMDGTGKVDKEAIKSRFEEELKDLPEFTSKKQIKVTAAKGADVPPAMTDDEEYRQRKYGKSRYFRG